MPVYSVTLPESGGPYKDGFNVQVILAADETDAKHQASSLYEGDMSWSTATVTELTGTPTMAGWSIRVAVLDASPVIDETFTVVASSLGVQSVAINGGGTGYTVGDVLTVGGGTSTYPTRLEVTSESGGVIDGVKVIDPGVYSAVPADPAAVTGGTGNDDADFNLTTSTDTVEVLAAGIVGLLNTTAITGAEFNPADETIIIAAGTGVDDLGDKKVEVVIKNDKGGSIPTFVGTITSEGSSTDDLSVVMQDVAYQIPSTLATLTSKQ